MVYLLHPEKRVGQQEALVLDSYVCEVISAQKRTDLEAVYMVDAKNNITLINDTNGTRTLKTEVDHAKYSKLTQIKAKMAENAEKYRAYNDGRPLC